MMPSPISSSTPFAPSRRAFIASCAAAGAGALCPGAVWAEAGDDLSFVNPELRNMARILQRVAASGKSFTMPANVPLPAGVREQQIPGRNGAPAVTVYVGNEAETGVTAPRGAILFIHGGGFVGGSGRLLGARLAQAKALGCLLVSVEYRLAPATHFPGSLEDNYTALLWLHEKAGEMGIDPNRIALLGESAGGGHVAMLAIAARDRGEVKPCFQALIYPMLDDRTGSTRPVPPNHGALVWTPAQNREGWAALLGQKAGLGHVPSNSVPARVKDLSGLPPTWIGVGGIDLFVDEDIEYARRLLDAGVPTELLVIPGAYHGFDQIVPQSSVSRQFNASLEAALAAALSA